ncbi:maleylpyruvate isomerase N-terminal domain-containing protein [Hymenobacter sp. UYP22]|uniref:maleylpyruvate isomerase N-terminal domain-containing protein n=1 Tax=Hymenobacter sp. UYP22 TaxID=3156348 RepID=UPI003392E9A6
MEPVAIPQTLPLFPELDNRLLEVLRSLNSTDWQRPWRGWGWTVHDVALHLLDGSLRSVSMLRDGHFVGAGPASGAYADVVTYLNQLNKSWVEAGRRLSPAVLIGLLEYAGPQYTALLHHLNPAAPAAFSVAWAGEEHSTNHFHIAREYTEKWHHQQQIRQAVGQQDALLQVGLYRPFLETCLQALPHHYREVAAPVGTLLRVAVTGQGHWELRREEAGWRLGHLPGAAATATIELPAPLAWRLFTKSLPLPQAAALLTLNGPEWLTAPFLSTLTVMA